jgi:pteridine reductase
MQIAGRVALVTGGGRRVGKAIALALGSWGARVAIHYFQSSRGASEAADEIRLKGGTAETFQADLRVADECGTLVRAARDAFGGLDILVNSAAIMVRSPVGEVTSELWDDVMALNLRAPFFCSQAAAALMPPGSAIVNIADLAGLESWPAYVPHSVSKAGVIHLTKSLARTLAPGIRVNSIAPGTVLLPEDWSTAADEHLRSTTPLGRHGSPADVTAALKYLLEADFVTGDTLIVDGGRHIR